MKKIIKTNMYAGIALVLFSTMSCNKTSQTTQVENEVVVEGTDSLQTSETYQHIALAKIKPEKWEEYVAAMQNNILNSRQETGNILFNLYQPEDGSKEVVFIERFKNDAAFEIHSKADYIPEKLTEESLIGEMQTIELLTYPFKQ